MMQHVSTDRQQLDLGKGKIKITKNKKVQKIISGFNSL